MKHNKLDPKLRLNHHVTAMEFIFKSVCVTCQLTEGGCRDFRNGDIERCYKRCWWFNQAVHKVTKILDKYDR